MPLVHDSNSGAKTNASAALAALIAAANFGAASAHLCCNALTHSYHDDVNMKNCFVLFINLTSL